MTQNVDLQRLVISMEANFKKYERALHKNNAQTNRQLRKMETRFEKAGVNIGKSLSGPLASVGALLGTREVSRYADTWTAASNKLLAAGVAAQDLTQRQGELVDMAVRTRTAYEPLVDLYARIQRSSANLAISQKQIADVTEITAKAFKSGGASASEQASGILQLSQALASGFLQGDELRSIRENAPVLAQAIADYYGTTIGQLKKLGAAGKITSNDIVQAILKAGPQIETAYGKTVATMSDAVTNLQTVTIQAIGEIDRLLGVSTRIVGVLKNVSESVAGASKTIVDLNDKRSDIGLLVAAFEKAEGATHRWFVKGSLLDKTLGKVVAGYRATNALSDKQSAIYQKMLPIFEEMIVARKKLIDLEGEASGFTFPIEDLRAAAVELRNELSAAGSFRQSFLDQFNSIGGDDWKQSFLLNADDVAASLAVAEQWSWGMNTALDSVGQGTILIREAYKQNAVNMKKDAALQTKALQNLAQTGFGALSASIADGELDWNSFASSMIRQLPQIIAQLQKLHEAGSGSGGGLGSLWQAGSSILASVFHDGGVAGASGGAARSVSADVFANASRYHDGGVAGLGPNEIPAILERGEVIIPNGAAVPGGQPINHNYYSSDNRISLDARYADRGVITHLRNQLTQLQNGLANQTSRKRRFD